MGFRAARAALRRNSWTDAYADPAGDATGFFFTAGRLAGEPAVGFPGDQNGEPLPNLYRTVV
jgi:hypothetical protein